MSIEREARECIELIALDGRYWASEKAKEDAAALWASEFKAVNPVILRDACLAALRSKPKGRPSLGDMWIEIRKLSTHTPPGSSKEQSISARKKMELKWAVSILEHPDPFMGLYQHSIDAANGFLAKWGFNTFEDAGEFLNPNYIPPNRD